MPSSKLTHRRWSHPVPPICLSLPPYVPYPDPYPPYPTANLPADQPSKLRPSPGRAPAEYALRVFHVGPYPNFQDIQLRAQEALGPQWHVEQIAPPNPAAIEQQLRTRHAAAVILHAEPIAAPDIIRLAKRWPATTWLWINHSSQNHNFTSPATVQLHGEILRASRELPNLHVASPDPYVPWQDLGFPDAFHWPNPIWLPPDRAAHFPDPPTIVLAGRSDWVKAWPAQITAARLLQRSHGARVFLCISHRTRTLPTAQLHAQNVGLEWEPHPWADQAAWLRFLWGKASILLQTSFSESFNYATLDAAAVRVPFVGSRAIRHTPDAWRVNDPNDSHEIAAVAARILDDLPNQAARARALAEQVAATNNRRYRHELCRLVGLPTERPLDKTP